MKYAIETLEIEINSIKRSQRRIDAISAEMMADHPMKKEYENSRAELEKAVSVLKAWNGPYV